MTTSILFKAACSAIYLSQRKGRLCGTIAIATFIHLKSPQACRAEGIWDCHPLLTEEPSDLIVYTCLPQRIRRTMQKTFKVNWLTSDVMIRKSAKKRGSKWWISSCHLSKSQCPCASGCPLALVVCCTVLAFSVLDSTVVFFSSLRGQAKAEHDSPFWPPQLGSVEA